MINKIFILLLTVLVVELYFLSFGQNQNFSIPMMKSMYEPNAKELVKVVSIITALGSICFLCFGLKYTSNFFWVVLLSSTTFASCLLGLRYVYGLHSEGTWGYIIFLTLVVTGVAFLIGIVKADMLGDPVSEMPE